MVRTTSSQDTVRPAFVTQLGCLGFAGFLVEGGDERNRVGELRATHKLDGHRLRVEEVCACGVPKEEGVEKEQGRAKGRAGGSRPSKMTPKEPSPILRPTR
jgi:hypothetical protein